ncbi:hypothetical protein, partial [Bifidobacterium vespertilionis]|uniref:hypothetical protein n=1 Tax=Bifidobacterium vespertilionis TaxID=2562524 RepID=UPI001CC2D9A3
PVRNDEGSFAALRMTEQDHVTLSGEPFIHTSTVASPLTSASNVTSWASSHTEPSPPAAMARMIAGDGFPSS